jgi:hypothetical protein
LAQPSDSEEDREGIDDDDDATESMDDRGLAEGLEVALPLARSFLRVHRLTSCLYCVPQAPLV